MRVLGHTTSLIPSFHGPLGTPGTMIPFCVLDTKKEKQLAEHESPCLMQVTGYTVSILLFLNGLSYILSEIVLLRLSYPSDSQESWRSIKSYDKPKG